MSAAFDAAGAPTRAALAFARELRRARSRRSSGSSEGKGTFLFFVGTKPGERAGAICCRASCRRALDALPIPRRMRWGAGEALFVRPVHWLVMLFGAEVVPATLLDTRGRARRPAAIASMRPRPLRIASAGSYERRCASAAG